MIPRKENTYYIDCAVQHRDDRRGYWYVVGYSVPGEGRMEREAGCARGTTDSLSTGLTFQDAVLNVISVLAQAANVHITTVKEATNEPDTQE